SCLCSFFPIPTPSFSCPATPPFLPSMTLTLPWRKNTSLTIVGSRSHATKELSEYVDKIKETYGEVEFLSAGSSLKFCLVAEGKADVYPRFGPTMEWDTAAGQAIIEQTGGGVVEVQTREPLKYNKSNLVNPFFIVSGQGFTAS
ncbi:MAG: hypothetical protein HUU08_17700, partial [Candidatus Brocadia sp.]|nr:hypothetical protein [Candidatus Brocadia sp.]